MNEKKLSATDAQKLFIAAMMLLTFAEGLSSKIFNNYFKEVYFVDSVQRGLLEIPRESPGILCVVVMALLAGTGNLSLIILANALFSFGALVLGVFSPSYAMMQVFLFICSLGEHLLMPLRDSVGLDLSKEGKSGTFLGTLRGRMNAAYMLASVMVFLGFRFGFFWFGEGVIPSFVAAAVFGILGMLCMVRLRSTAPRYNKHEPKEKKKLRIRKEYIPYYIVTAVYGCQKRMRIVFAPWIIIELMNMGADVLALLGIAAYFVATLTAPAIGKYLDKNGVKKALRLESIVIAAIFLFSAWATVNVTGKESIPIFFVICAFVAYVMIIQTDYFGTVHTMLMKKLSLDPQDITENLSMGLSVDHVLAVTVSGILGLMWKAWGPYTVFLFAAAVCAIQYAVSVFLPEDM